MTEKKKNLSEFTPFEFSSAQNTRIGIVVSEWNDRITDSLLKGARECLLEHGMKEENIFYELTHDYPLDDIKNAHDPQFTKSIRPFLTMLNVLKTECIYALVVENDIDKANMLQQQFDKVADSYPYAVEIHLERSLLDQALFQFGYYAL